MSSQVECHAKALPKEVLMEKIKDVHAIGIRSKTLLTAEVLREAKKLLCIGCFCIGTNQVDLDYAANHGVCSFCLCEIHLTASEQMVVFNSPFSNSRSVGKLYSSSAVYIQTIVTPNHSGTGTGRDHCSIPWIRRQEQRAAQWILGQGHSYDTC